MKFFEVTHTNPSAVAQGLFVCKDETGLDCCVGDRVRVRREAVNFVASNGVHINLPEQTWEGVLTFMKSAGVRIRLQNGRLLHAKYGKTAKTKWHWQLIQ